MVPVSLNDVLNVLCDPATTPFKSALNVPANPSWKFEAVDVLFVPDVYLLTVLVFKLCVADIGLVAELSVNPDANLGDVPVALDDNVIDFDDRPEGADGLAFIVNVIALSESDCAVMSGVPVAVNAKLYEPVPTPVNECGNVAPIDPGEEPSSATESLDDPSFQAYT